MQTHHSDSTTPTARAADFTADELALLRDFYAGVRAHELRRLYARAPWAVVHRHRQLPADQYEAIAALVRLPGACR